MNVIKAVAAVALWRTGKFDTADIATALDIHEADVCRVLHLAREEDRKRASQVSGTQPGTAAGGTRTHPADRTPGVLLAPLPMPGVHFAQRDGGLNDD